MDSKGEDFNYITTFLVFVITFLLVYFNTRRQKGVPPGPALFPILGNLPSLASADTLGTLNEIRSKYGDVFGLYTGRKLVVFLNGYDVIHDALVKKGSQFMFRDGPGFDQDSDQHTKGLIFSNGIIWKEGRKFAIATLQEICYSDKGLIEHLVDYEVNDLTEMIMKLDQPFDIECYLNSSIQNVIFQVIYGQRFDLNDEDLHWLQRTIRIGSKNYLTREVILNCLPFLKHLPVDILSIKKDRDDFVKQMNFLSSLIEKLKSEEKSTSRKTFVECYLDRLAANKSHGIESTFDESDMKISAYNLVVAGSETTANTVRWLLLYLIRNPHIQDEIYDEIRDVLGKDSPSVKDKKRMPYTQAVILEGLRISHVAPLSVPHTVEQNISFRGYVIPKKCTIIPVLSSALKDPDVWDNPEEFRPSRFLNAEGNEVTVPKQFIPFSLGPRSCLGETLATIEIFLFLTGLVQKVKFLPEQENLYPEPKGEFGLTFAPKNFKMRIEKR